MKSFWKWAFETTPIWNWVWWSIVGLTAIDLIHEFIKWVS